MELPACLGVEPMITVAGVDRIASPSPLPSFKSPTTQPNPLPLSPYPSISSSMHEKLPNARLSEIVGHRGGEGTLPGESCHASQQVSMLEICSNSEGLAFYFSFSDLA